MSTEAYKDVRLVLGESDAAFGKTVASAIFPLGLRDVSVCQDGDAVRRATASAVDVVACDTRLPGLEFKSFVQELRHGKVGANPFVILIATARDEDEAKTTRLSAPGFDDLMVKPINPLMLIRRIGALSKNRGGFVLTPNYVGPTRRTERRNDGSDDALVAVPNTLRAKMVEQKRGAAIEGIVAEGKTTLAKSTALSGIIVIVRLAARLATLLATDAPLVEFQAALKGLGAKAAEAVAEHKDSHPTSHVPPIAECVARLAVRMESSAEKPSRMEVDLLARLADAALMAATAETRATDAVPEIVAVVDGYLARA